MFTLHGAWSADAYAPTSYEVSRRAAERSALHQALTAVRPARPALRVPRLRTRARSAVTPTA